MSQLQFRSDDTTPWEEGFGNRVDGDVSPSGTFPNQHTTFTGVQDAQTGTVGANTGFAVGDIVLIHQSRNGGDGAGVWQLNKITGISGTTITFKYKMMNDYGTTAQMIKVLQHRTVTISATIAPNAWDGSTGGIIVYLADKITGTSGTINLNDKGFRGGDAVDGVTIGKQGEGTSGGPNTQSVSANGNGGGGGGYSNNGPWDQGNGGGGGANTQTDGSAGIGTGGGNNSNGGGGALGSASGNSDLTIMTFGGGGGSGGDNNGSGATGYGGKGAGIAILIARDIDLSDVAVNMVGSQGEGNRSFHAASGGSGAGGSCLIKGCTVNVGSNKINANGGTRVYNNGSTPGDADGGSGGDGRVHVDYSVSLTGTSSPTLTSTLDVTINDRSGFLGLLL